MFLCWSWLVVQLVGVNLVGVMFFGSWASSLAKVSALVPSF
ncbi:MAG: Hypothetical protein AJITA_00621 [Acetilactobacillus jinshanensis]